MKQQKRKKKKRKTEEIFDYFTQQEMYELSTFNSVSNLPSHDRRKSHNVFMEEIYNISMEEICNIYIINN